MAQRTYYEVLMLHPSATSVVITVVYRQLARQFHSDQSANPNDARMAEINEAYAVLSDPEKRSLYDESLGLSASRAASGAELPAEMSAPGATNMKYSEGGWAVRDPSDPRPAPSVYGEAGPPPTYPPATGSVLSFGRYKGWAISQVAAQDRDYLEWLQRTMAGRTYAEELKAYLG